MDKQNISGITIKRQNKPNKYDNKSKFRNVTCDCCDDAAMVQIITTKLVLNKNNENKIINKRLFLCEKHRDLLKEYLKYFE